MNVVETGLLVSNCVNQGAPFREIIYQGQHS